MILPETDEFASRFPDEIRTLLTMLRMGNLGGLAVAECDDLDLRARLRGDDHVFPQPPRPRRAV